MAEPCRHYFGIEPLLQLSIDFEFEVAAVFGFELFAAVFGVAVFAGAGFSAAAVLLLVVATADGFFLATIAVFTAATAAGLTGLLDLVLPAGAFFMTIS